MTARNRFYVEFMTDPPLTPEEVAARMHVVPKTVTRWCDLGWINPSKVFRTPGGHRRIRLSALTDLNIGEAEHRSERPSRSALPRQRTKNGVSKHG